MYSKIRSQFILEEVEGLGTELAKRLYLQFGGLQGLKKASDIELLKIKGVGATLLKRIKNATTGGTITNPTKTGKRRIKITTLLKRRVNFALNVR